MRSTAEVQAYVPGHARPARSRRYHEPNRDPRMIDQPVQRGTPPAVAFSGVHDDQFKVAQPAIGQRVDAAPRCSQSSTRTTIAVSRGPAMRARRGSRGDPASRYVDVQRLADQDAVLRRARVGRSGAGAPLATARALSGCGLAGSASTPIGSPNVHHGRPEDRHPERVRDPGRDVRTPAGGCEPAAAHHAAALRPRMEASLGLRPADAHQAPAA